MSDATFADVTDGVRKSVGEDCGLGSRVKFDLKDDGVIWVDATTVPNVRTRITMPIALWSCL